MLKLNSIPASVFEVTGKDNIVVNGEQKISRNEIVSTGRLLTVERVGKMINNRKIGTDKYESRLEGMGVDYATLSKKHGEKAFLFAATQAYKVLGKDAPTMEEAKADPALRTNSIFINTLAAIAQDVITPITFHIFDDVSANGLMEWRPVALGETTEFLIRSNDVVLFEDSAPGSAHSASKNYLYAKSVPVTAKRYVSNVTLKFYQTYVNGDPADVYVAIINGMWSKVYALFISALTSAASNTAYIPTALTASTYSTANWLTVCTNVAIANGVGLGDLVAFGDISALSQVLPIDGTGGAITGLQYGLGEEWFKNGYLQRAGQVDLVATLPVLVPGTQNSSFATLGLGSNIYIAAKGMRAPIAGVYATGSPITLVADATKTADETVDINITAWMNVVPLFAQKVGKISSVYAS